MKILDKFTKDFSREKYIQSWKELTITANEWNNHRHIDHWEELDKMTLHEDEEVLIIKHQRKLFNELVKTHVDKTLLHLENNDKVSGKTMIDYHIKLIDSFINNCENKHNNKFLADVFNMVPFREPILVFHAYHNIASSFPSPLKKRYSLTEPSKPGYSNWFIAEIIYQYQLAITQLWSEKEESPLSESIKPSLIDTETKIASETKDNNNDFTKSTIEDYLDPIKENFTEESYIVLVDELLHYFTTGSFSDSKPQIKTKGKTNIKRIGWNLHEVYKNCRTDNSKLPIEYLLFAKNHISVFKGISIEESKYRDSKLYKYFTSKP